MIILLVLGCMSFCSCYFFFLLLLVFLVFPSLSHQCFSYFFHFLFCSCISFDCSCCCVSFSLFLLSIFCFFFSRRPPRALEKENHGKNNYLILFACRGSLRECPCKKVIAFFLWWISFLHRTCFAFDVLAICVEGVRDSLLLLICSDFVVLVFGKEPSFGPTCLLCLHSLYLLSFLSVFPFFWCFCLFRVFMGSVFCFHSIPHLGFAFSSLLCGRAVLFFLPVWPASFTCGHWCCHFVVTLSGGAFENGRPGGFNIFCGFSHNRSVWVKTGAGPQGEGFCKRFLLQNQASKRWII